MTAFYIKLEFSGKIYLDIKFPAAVLRPIVVTRVLCLVTESSHELGIGARSLEDVVDMQHRVAVKTDEELAFIDRLAVVSVVVGTIHHSVLHIWM